MRFGREKVVRCSFWRWNSKRDRLVRLGRWTTVGLEAVASGSEKLIEQEERSRDWRFGIRWRRVRREVSG